MSLHTLYNLKQLLKPSKRHWRSDLGTSFLGSGTSFLTILPKSLYSLPIYSKILQVTLILYTQILYQVLCFSTDTTTPCFKKKRLYRVTNNSPNRVCWPLLLYNHSPSSNYSSPKQQFKHYPFPYYSVSPTGHFPTSQLTVKSKSYTVQQQKIKKKPFYKFQFFPKSFLLASRKPNFLF